MNTTIVRNFHDHAVVETASAAAEDGKLKFVGQEIARGSEAAPC